MTSYFDNKVIFLVSGKQHVIEELVENGITMISEQFKEHKKLANFKYTHGKRLGNTSCVTRVNLGLNVSYTLNML